MTPRTDSDKKCENCKWNNLFWKESGCSKFNAMEPCKFEPKEALKDGKAIDADRMKEELLWGNVFLSAKETNALVDLIDNQPTLTPPNEWVSVKNKKPELGERVLATDGAFVGEGYMDCYGVWCRPNGMRWNMLESEVTHWMPLPAPPDRRPPEQIDMLERMESE